MLIPASPDLAHVEAVSGARQLDYPADKLEILVARGKQPSAQRNAGMKAAHGDIIYFLDNDSVPQPDALRKAVSHYKDPRVVIVGGPNLCPPDAPPLEQVFALVHSSWLAFGPSRTRYARVGTLRSTSEKELILCNMTARRETMLAAGGFNVALYPNEENALMDALRKDGGRLLYDPEMIVYRRPRRTLKSFCRMLMTYGRGRAEQFREHPTTGSIPNFVPPAFCVYLLALPILPVIFAAPLGLYAAVLLIQTLLLMPRGGFVRSLCSMPLMALTHILYGIGFWRGLFTRLKPADQRGNVPVQLETVPR